MRKFKVSVMGKHDGMTWYAGREIPRRDSMLKKEAELERIMPIIDGVKRRFSSEQINRLRREKE